MAAQSQDLIETIQRTLTKPGGTAEGEAENSGNISLNLLQTREFHLVLGQTQQQSWPTWVISSGTPTQQGLHERVWWLVSSLVLVGLKILLELLRPFLLPVVN